MDLESSLGRNGSAVAWPGAGRTVSAGGPGHRDLAAAPDRKQLYRSGVYRLVLVNSADCNVGALEIQANSTRIWRKNLPANRPQAVEAGIRDAKARIQTERRKDRIGFLLSAPMLLVWASLLLCVWWLSPIIGPAAWIPIGFCMPVAYALAPAHRQRSVTARLAGLTWSRNDFCRGWLITGDTGAGKTFAVTALLHSVFQHEPDWGGLCCDEKGIYHETLTRMAVRYGRSEDLILLQTRPDFCENGWTPPARFNLLSDPTIPWSTYAAAIVDTATAVGGGTDDKGFFRTQAQSHIGRAIQLFRLLGRAPTLHGILLVLQHPPALRFVLQKIDAARKANDPEAAECYDHFLNTYLRQPAEQLGGVTSTIYNYLNYFAHPDLVEVFGAEKNTFDFGALDRGAIICLAMPQKFQTERRYVTTLLKLLFYNYVLRRFDPRPPGARSLGEDNLLICWQDEAQRFITESDGNVDVIRQAQATTVLATQSKLAFGPALGSKEKAEVTILNLRNRIIFKAADRACAEGSADFIGKRMIWKRSYTRGRGQRSVTRNRDEEYLVKPFELMKLPKFTAIVRHCERGHRKAQIHPVDADGRTPAWYPFWRRLC
jgi:hypothetical protein